MTSGVAFTLHTGETLTIASDDLQPLCNLLWGLAPKPGAASMAGIVHLASRQRGGSRLPYELAPRQSALLREAATLLNA